MLASWMRENVKTLQWGNVISTKVEKLVSLQGCVKIYKSSKPSADMLLLDSKFTKIESFWFSKYELFFTECNYKCHTILSFTRYIKMSAVSDWITTPFLFYNLRSWPDQKWMLYVWYVEYSVDAFLSLLPIPNMIFSVDYFPMQIENILTLLGYLSTYL